MKMGDRDPTFSESLTSWQHLYGWNSKNRETPQNGWLIMENPIKMGFGGTTIFGNIEF